MSTFSISNRLGLLMHNYSNLVKGKADIGTASKLGVLTTSLQQFLDGKANLTMAIRLGVLTTDLQQMLNTVGRQGAIGIIMGLLAAANKQ